MILNSFAAQRLAISTLFILCCLVFAGCTRGGNNIALPTGQTVLSDAPLSPSTVSTANVLALEKDLGLPLPVDTSVVNYSETRGSDKLIRAKLLVSQQAFEEWLKSFDVSFDDFEEEKRYQLGPSTDWWDPDRPPSLPVIQIPLENASFLNVGYETIADEQLQIYLVLFET